MNELVIILLLLLCTSFSHGMFQPLWRPVKVSATLTGSGGHPEMVVSSAKDCVRNCQYYSWCVLNCLDTNMVCHILSFLTSPLYNSSALSDTVDCYTNAPLDYATNAVVYATIYKENYPRWGIHHVTDGLRVGDGKNDCFSSNPTDYPYLIVQLDRLSLVRNIRVYLPVFEKHSPSPHNDIFIGGEDVSVEDMKNKIYTGLTQVGTTGTPTTEKYYSDVKISPARHVRYVLIHSSRMRVTEICTLQIT